MLFRSDGGLMTVMSPFYMHKYFDEDAGAQSVLLGAFDIITDDNKVAIGMENVVYTLQASKKLTGYYSQVRDMVASEKDIDPFEPKFNPSIN